MCHAQGVGACLRGQHEVNRLMRLGQRHRHHHALAGGQPVRLDHNGRAFSLDISVRSQRVAEGFVIRRWNAVTLHEGLGKSLGTLQLRRGPGGAKNPQTVGAEFVHNAGGQGLLGADHCQGNFF